MLQKQTRDVSRDSRQKSQHNVKSQSTLVEAMTAMQALFFFFQAEDGIRDYKVTGVQTCALPILRTPWSAKACASEPSVPRLAATAASIGAATFALRSEERRVGKEGRARWSRELKSERKQGEARRARECMYYAAKADEGRESRQQTEVST